MSLLRGILSTIRSGYLGLLGQSLAIFSLFIPVLGGKSNLLPNLVFISAFSAILIPTTTLAAQVRLPVLPDKLMSPNVRNVATTITLTVCSLFIAGMVILEPLPEMSVILISLSATHLGHSAYIFMNALLVRSGKVVEITRLRFTYNLATLLLTLLALFIVPTTFGFSLATGFGFLVGVAVTWARNREILRHGSNSDLTEESHEKLKSGRLLVVIGVQTGSSITHQAFALVAPILGTYAVAWSLVLRIANGLETLGGVILGPILDAEFISHRTAGDFEKLRQVIGKAVALGGVLGAVGVVFVGLMELLKFLSLSGSDANSDPIALIMLCLFIFGHVSISPIGRIVYFLNKHKLKFWMEFLRAGFVTTAIVVQDAESKLILLAVGSITSAIVTLAWFNKLANGGKARDLFFKD